MNINIRENFLPSQKNIFMYRTHTCGELSIKNVGDEVTLSGWVQRIRDKGTMLWLDLRDRYGITQFEAIK